METRSDGYFFDGTGVVTPQVYTKKDQAETKLDRAVKMLVLDGLDFKSIGKELGLTANTVQVLLGQPLALRKIQDLKKAHEHVKHSFKNWINELAGLSLEVLQGILLDANEDTRLRAKIAFALLDRAGYTPVGKTMAMVMHTEITDSDLRDIVEQYSQINKESPNVE